MIEFKKYDGEYNPIVTYLVKDSGLTINEIMQEFRYFLLALGYHPESIAEYIEAE